MYVLDYVGLVTEWELICFVLNNSLKYQLQKLKFEFYLFMSFTALLSFTTNFKH